MKQFILRARFPLLILTLMALIFATDTGAKQLLLNPANSTSPLGTNLGALRDYSTDLVFLDGFKSSRPWITRNHSSHTWDTGEEASLDLDANGWVRSLPEPGSGYAYDSVAALMFRSLGNGRYPSGQYIVLYDGEGTIEYELDAEKNVESTPGRDVIDVTPTEQGVLLVITATDPNGTGDYIRNIRVIMPGYESSYQTQIFNPAFIDTISKYRVIRFMDWMETNETTQSSWADRPLLSHARWTNRDGVPVEMMTTLSNYTGADPWFTIPHLADDNYIAQFAATVLDNLDPNLKVYVEYSNEVWNPGFPQSTWVEQQAIAEWPGGSESNFTKKINWYGKRTAEMCDIWENAWGAQSDRVICVMGSQAANPWTARTALDCSMWAGAPCQDHNIDALAIAPYFGGYLGKTEYEAVVQSWTADPDGGLDRLFNEIFNGGELSGGPSGGALNQAIDWIALNADVTDPRGLDLISYEGGQHLVGVYGVINNNAITNLFARANRDPRMGLAYEQYLAAWKNSGGKLFTHFRNSGQYTRYGSWGSFEYLDAHNTPKYNALMGFIDANPCWWPDCEAVGGIPTPQPTGTPVPQPTGTPVPQPTETSVPQPTETTVPQPTETSIPQPTESPTPPPPPVSTWYLAEGFTAYGFATFILIQNPNDTMANVTLTYMLQGEEGPVEPIVRTVEVLPNSRYTVVAHDEGQVGLGWAFSTRLDADQPIFVERAMYWPNGESSVGGHVTIGVTSAKNTWYLAEGFTDGGFETFILIQNPNGVDATVTLTYMLQGGGTVEKDVVVPANSRFTVLAHAEDQVGTGKAFSTRLVGDQPIIVERAMYFNNGGHNTNGIPDIN